VRQIRHLGEGRRSHRPGEDQIRRLEARPEADRSHHRRHPEADRSHRHRHLEADHRNHHRPEEHRLEADHRNHRHLEAGRSRPLLECSIRSCALFVLLPNKLTAKLYTMVSALQRFSYAALLALAGPLFSLAVLWLQPRCGFAQMFGIPCPSCGSTRSALGLVRGDWSQALRMNPVGMIAVGMLGIFWVRAIAVLLREGTLRGFGLASFERHLARVLGAVVGLEILVWIARFFGLFGGPVSI
jgi:hypothetical protein